MSRQTYEAAIALSNAAVALVYRQQFRYAMSVLQDSIYLMNNAFSNANDRDAASSTEEYSSETLHDKDMIRRFILNAEQRLAVTLTDSSPIDQRFEVVVLSTDDMNPDTFMHSYRFKEVKNTDFVVHIMENMYLECEGCEDEEVDGCNFTNYDIHSAIILYNYAVACKLCSFDRRIMNDELSSKKVNDSSMKLFHLSYAILQRELEYLPSSDRVIPDENEEVWQVTSCVYYMIMLVLHYLADLKNLSGEQNEREIFLNELDRLSNNYTIIHGMVSDKNYDQIGNIVTAPAA